MTWKWELVGTSSTYHGTASGHESYDGTVSADYLGEAILELVRSWEGFELMDEGEPITLTLTPVGEDE